VLGLGKPLIAKTPQFEYPEPRELIIIQGNTLVAVSNPSFTFQLSVLGVLVGGDDTELVQRIIFCESGGNSNVCNKQYGCYAGMGLFQLIPSTVKYCEEKLGKKIDPFNKRDNTECAIWLLENEGTSHWNQSKSCWKL